MRNLLIRTAYLDDCTMGTWLIGGSKFAGLGEPWIPDPDGPGGQRREPGKRESCVPDGLYKMSVHISEKYPTDRWVWRLSNPSLGIFDFPNQVPAKYGRSSILMHSGNDTDDILGCELAGMSRIRHPRDPGRYWVAESQKAFQAIRSILGKQDHELEIRSTRGTTELGGVLWVSK